MPETILDERRSGRGDSSSGGWWFLLPVAVFFLNLAISWQKWGDPLIDSGRELFTPARLAAGERLYQDVHYYYGPLAPELNALLYRCFGVRMIVLVAAGSIASLLGLLALFGIGRRCVSPASSALAAALVAAVPFFLPVGGAMPFPYSFDALYAAVLGWWALEAWLSARPHREAAAALMIALAACAKADLAFLFYAAISLAMLTGSGPRLRRFLRFSFIAAALPALVYGTWMVRLPLDSLVTEGFLVVLRLPAQWRLLYRNIAGFDIPAVRLLELVLVDLLLACMLLVPLVLIHLLARSGLGASRSGRALAGSAAGIFFAAIGFVWIWPALPLASLLMKLPPVVRILPPLMVLLSLIGLFRRNRSAEPWLPPVLVLAAGATSWRIFLNARYASPYDSFGLVLPVFAVALFLLHRCPELVSRKRPGIRWAAAAISAATLAAWGTTHLAWNVFYYRDPGRWGKVDSLRGALYATPPARGRTVSEALDLIRRETAPGDRVAVVPEGSILNFFGERRPGIPQEQILPGMLDEKAERELVSRLEKDPPEFFVYVDFDFAVWRSGPFGVDYNRELGDFIRRRYAPVGIVDHSKEGARGLGTPAILLLKRRG